MSPRKTCTKCLTRKPLTSFYKDKRCVDGRYSACKICARRAANIWKKAQAEWVAEYTRRYRLAHPELTAQKMREWRKKNKPKLRGYWAKWNPVCNAKRRALKKAALCNCCSADAFLELYERARRLGMHVDHVHPLSKGGIHCLRNLQLLTPLENQRKGAKLPGNIFPFRLKEAS